MKSALYSLRRSALVFAGIACIGVAVAALPTRANADDGAKKKIVIVVGPVTQIPTPKGK